MRSTEARRQVFGALAAVLTCAACVDYAGPPPERETQSNQPDTMSPPSGMSPPGAAPTSTARPSTTPPTGEVGLDMAAGGEGPPAAEADLVSFDSEVHPILVAKCGMCHEGAAPALPDHGAADLDVSFAAMQALSNDEPVYVRVLARASGDDASGMMPPGCAGPPGSAGGCLTQAEFDIIERWVEQGATNR